MTGEAPTPTAQRSMLEQQLADAKLRYLYAQTAEIRARWLAEIERLKGELADAY